MRKKPEAPVPLPECVLQELDAAERLLLTLPEPERSEAAGLIRRYRAPHCTGIERLQARARLMELQLIPEPAPAEETPDVPEAVSRGYSRSRIPIIGATRKEPSPRKAVTVRLSDVQAEDVQWLWPGRFALHTVNVLAGDGGAGKSTLTGAITATITSGGCWPDCPGEPVPTGSVLILTAEEHLASAVRPRLDRFGADVSRVHVLTTTADDDGRLTPFSLARDCPILEEEVRRIGGIRLVVIDPVGSYIGGIDNANESEVRDAVQPLFRLAEKHQLAVILVMHLNKREGGAVQSRIAMSAAFVNQARMVWFVSKHPTDKGRRVLSPVKLNLEGATANSLTVGYAGGALAWDPEPIDWDADQVAALLAGEAARAKPPARGRPSDELGRAKQFVLNLVQNGPCLQSAVLDAAGQSRIAESTARRAVRVLQEDDGLITGYRPEGDSRQWLRRAAETQTELFPDPPGTKG